MLLTIHAWLLAKGSGGHFDAQGLIGWFQDNIIPILLFFIGMVIMFGSHSGNWSKQMNRGGIALFGLMFIIVGVGWKYLAGDISNAAGL